jgi:hypothetical protein
VAGKGCRRVNSVQKLCTHVANGKTICVKTIPEMGEGGLKENSRGGEFKYDIFDIFVRTFVNSAMHLTQHKIKEKDKEGQSWRIQATQF